MVNDDQESWVKKFKDSPLADMLSDVIGDYMDVCGVSTYIADDLLEFLDEKGYTIAPKKPTRAMLESSDLIEFLVGITNKQDTARVYQDLLKGIDYGN